LLTVLDGKINLRDVTAADADACLRRLRERYASATVGATIKRARQFFRAAVRARLIVESPFADVKPPPETNTARKYFVSQEDTELLIEACPNGEWRLLIALARYGGLRTPSEVQALEWSGVNWELDRFWVPSPKTERFQGKAGRWVPIFGELRQHLEEAWERAPEGAVYVVTQGRQQGADVNLRTGLARIIKKAGLRPWPRLWQNLRASRETELAETFPVHVVCEWIGNSARVAANHYLQVTSEHFQRAANSGAVRCKKRCSSESQGARTESQESAETSGNDGPMQEGATECDDVPNQPLSPTGFEHVACGSGGRAPTCVSFSQTRTSPLPNWNERPAWLGLHHR
jgi:site-specific recombinase XerD